MFDVCIGFYFLINDIHVSFCPHVAAACFKAGLCGCPAARANVNSHVFPVAV